VVVTKEFSSRGIRRGGVGNVEGVGRDLGVVDKPRLGQHHKGLVLFGPV
jgi:hypothetical protein